MGKFNCTDSGNVQRLLAFYGNKFRYVEAWQRFMVWDGQRWLADPKGTRVLGLTAELAGRVYAEWKAAEDEEERDRLWAWYLQTQSASRRKAVVELARGEVQALARPEEFDANKLLLTVPNGTLDLRTGAIRPHNPADMLTQATNVIFDPKASSPLWQAFLEKVLPDAEVRDFLQKFVGYCLTGSVKERMIVVLYGRGRNGKSVLLRVLYELLGPYAGTIRPDMLLVRGGEPHPTEEAALQGKRLVVTSEVRKGRRFDEEKVKGLTGGDIRAARRMQEDFWDLKPTAKIVVAANHKPGVADASDSFWDRMALIPFKVRLADDEVDKDLFEKLCKELPGILNWAVEGCLAWQKDGLVRPGSVREASEAYRAAEDRMADFVSEHLEFNPLGRINHSEVMELAKTWCGANNVFVFSDKAVGERLMEAGAERVKSNGVRLWRGVKRRNPSAISAKPGWRK